MAMYLIVLVKMSLKFIFCSIYTFKLITSLVTTQQSLVTEEDDLSTTNFIKLTSLEHRAGKIKSLDGILLTGSKKMHPLDIYSFSVLS